MTVLDPTTGAGAADPLDDVDPFDVRFVRSADGLLRSFNVAGVLAAADVHVATRLAARAGEIDERVLLAVAFAVRGPRLGHVCVDLATVGGTVVIEGDVAVDVAALPWPDPAEWVAAVAASPLVDVSADAVRPLRLVGSRLYLDRYWREEQFVARDLAGRANGVADDVNDVLLRAGLDRLFVSEEPADADLQRRAAAATLRRRLTVIAGGPGTGKTTTVAKILALVHEQAAAQGRVPLVALAAPTGKAAARLQEAVHEAAATVTAAGSIDASVRDALLGASAMTLHRLLGRKPRSSTRFRHDRSNRLPHDLVIVDETSMVSLTLMARLLEAVRPTARLVLVGDPEQLASVEAGAVLGDIVGPAGQAPDVTSGAGAVPGSASEIGESIVVLRRGYRFGGTITSLAAAIRAGDADEVVAVMRSPAAEDVTWVEADAAATGIDAAAPAELRSRVVTAGGALVAAATAGDGAGALDALGRFRLLCAHRRGPYGVTSWTALIESWLAADVPAFEPRLQWHAGRPILYTENDYALQLYNGDTGVVVASPSGDGLTLRAVFERRGRLVELSPQRLGRVETVHAMTVHKAQGSQFEDVALLLPEPSSPILTRELLYTAATRAQRSLLVVATEEAVRAAVERPIARASGLRELLWS